MAREYNFPVYVTQGGGLAREIRGVYIFVEKPDVPGLDIGDEVPEMWDVQPVNAAAQQEVEDISDFERACDLSLLLQDPELDEADRDAISSTLLTLLNPTIGADDIGGSLDEEDAATEALLDSEERLFAARLRKVMEEKKITEEVLAQQVGLTSDTLGRILSCDTRPQKRTVEKLAKATHASAEYLWPVSPRVTRNALASFGRPFF
jgi:DNA-binding phage protein